MGVAERESEERGSVLELYGSRWQLWAGALTVLAGTLHLDPGSPWDLTLGIVLVILGVGVLAWQERGPLVRVGAESLAYSPGPFRARRRVGFEEIEHAREGPQSLVLRRRAGGRERVPVGRLAPESREHLREALRASLPASALHLRHPAPGVARRHRVVWIGLTLLIAATLLGALFLRLFGGGA